MSITSLRVQTYHSEFVRDWKPREPSLPGTNYFVLLFKPTWVKRLVFLMSICVDNYSITHVTLDRFVTVAVHWDSVLCPETGIDGLRRFNLLV